LWPAACSPSAGEGKHPTYDSMSLLGLTQAPGSTNTTMVTDYLGADDTLSPIGNNTEAEAAAAAALASPRPRRERKSKRGPAFHMDLEQRWLYPLVLSDQALARVVARTPLSRRGPSLSSSSSFSSASASASASSPLEQARPFLCEWGGARPVPSEIEIEIEIERSGRGASTRAEEGGMTAKRRTRRKGVEQAPATRPLTQASLSWTSRAAGEEGRKKRKQKERGTNKHAFVCRTHFVKSQINKDTLWTPRVQKAVFTLGGIAP
jgi:hypothetical protein